MTTTTTTTKPAEKHDAACEAASICPTCASKLVFRGCKAICTSDKCVFRIVLTCSDQ